MIISAGSFSAINILHCKKNAFLLFYFKIIIIYLFIFIFVMFLVQISNNS